MVDFLQNIRCFSDSRLFLKNIKGKDNIAFTYPYISKYSFNRQTYIFFPDKLRFILNKFESECEYIYNGYIFGHNLFNFNNRYRHSETLYTNEDVCFNYTPMKSFFMIPTSNKKFISTLKVCL